MPIPTRRSGNAVVCQTEHFSDFIAVVIDSANPFGSCGNGMCDPTEGCTSCPFDCGLCLVGADGGVPGDAGVLVDAAMGTDAGSDAGTPLPRFVNNGDGSVTDTLT